MRGALLAVLAVVSLRAQYGTAGPAILSRSGVLGRTNSEPQGLFAIQPWIAANGYWDSGYQRVVVDANGVPQPVTAYGYGGSVGARGWHNWRRTLLGVNYVLTARRYPDRPGIDGVDQLLNLGIGHQLTRRLAISFNEMGGWFSRSAGLWNPGFYSDPILNTAPTGEIFDVPVRFAATSGSLVYTMSTRWSLSFSGMGSIVRRKGSSFAGLNAWGGLADAAYRLSRRQTIGFYYAYQHYDFTRVFGATDVHHAGIQYSQMIGPHASLSLLAGGARAESLFTQRVTLDPEVAAILGTGTGVQAFYGINYMGVYRGSITRTFKRSSVGANGGQTMTPGNGYYLTSRTQFATGTYSYSASRRVSMSLFASYQSMSALTKSLDKFQSFYEGVNVSHSLSNYVSWGMSFYHRHQLAGSAGYKRDSYAAMVHLAIHGRAYPVSLW